MKDSQHKKFQITINNPAQKGLDYEAIKKALEQLTALDYFCLADEVGLETHTAHSHFCSPAELDPVQPYEAPIP